MSRTIKMKEIERTVNNFWRVQRRYYTTVTESTDYKSVVFSIYDADTDEVILDMNVMCSQCIDELFMRLDEEIRNICNMNCVEADKTKVNYGAVQYNKIRVFCYEWLEIFEMVSEYIKSSYCLYDDRWY